MRCSCQPNFKCVLGNRLRVVCRCQKQHSSVMFSLYPSPGFDFAPPPPTAPPQPYPFPLRRTASAREQWRTGNADLCWPLSMMIGGGRLAELFFPLFSLTRQPNGLRNYVECRVDAVKNICGRTLENRQPAAHAGWTRLRWRRLIGPLRALDEPVCRPAGHSPCWPDNSPPTARDR